MMNNTYRINEKFLFRIHKNSFYGSSYKDYPYDDVIESMMIRVKMEKRNSTIDKILEDE